MGYLAPTRRSEEDMSELLTLRPGQDPNWTPIDRDTHRTREEYLHFAALADTSALDPVAAHIRSRLLGASRRADLAQYRRALAGVRLPTDFGGLVIDICADRKQHTMYDYALLVRNVQTLFGAGMRTFNLHKIICVGYRQESVRGAISRSGESWVERAVGHIKRVSAGRVKRCAGEMIANDVLSDMALRANANMLSQDEQSVVDAIITPPPRKPLDTITTLEYTFSFLPRPVSASDIRTFVDAIREAIRTWGFSLPGWTVGDLLPYAIHRTFRVTRDTIQGREEFFATGWSSTERGINLKPCCTLKFW
ncbi:hypothetical protein BSKO_13507 [Bryopsis sp. KO-2023]|nr:hypothetical protein BSKO_13507 [Bryopsis sp. KO-2023]